MLPAHVAAIILFVTKLPMYVIYAAMAVLSIKLLVVFFACTTIYATVACCFKNRKKISKFFKEVLKQIRGDEQTSTDSFINANTMFISKVIFFVLL